MQNLLKEYKKPDERWEIWGVNSHSEFMSKFMVIGRFHDNVPELIKEEFKVVERLLCYSYYHYPLIDEAFSKVTRIFESAISLRLKELNIPDEKKIETLDKKIKKIEAYTSSTLMKDWNAAKNIRNSFAHPIAGSLRGITLFNGFFQMVNILNTIFLDKTIVEYNIQALNQLKEVATPFKKGLFKFQIEDKNFLVWSILPYSFFENKNVKKSFWVIHPVLTYFPQKIDKINFSLPIFQSLKNIRITENSFEATNIYNNKMIFATPTNKKENIELLNKHQAQIESSEIEVKQAYWNLLEHEINNEVVKFLYENCWE